MHMGRTTSHIFVDRPVFIKVLELSKQLDLPHCCGFPDRLIICPVASADARGLLDVNAFDAGVDTAEHAIGDGAGELGDLLRVDTCRALRT